MFDLDQRSAKYSPELQDEELFNKKKKEDIWNACIIILSLLINQNIPYGYGQADIG